MHLNLTCRWFCRLGLEGAVPDHSTFSRVRRGRFVRVAVRRCLSDMHAIERACGAVLPELSSFLVLERAQFVNHRTAREIGVEGQRPEEIDPS
jgi:hypothetical protein